MACNSPLRGIYKGVDRNGKKILKIVPYEAWTTEAFQSDSKYFEIPCGHCLGCRTAQSREWSNRLLLESLYHDSAYFVTLTYCDAYTHVVDGLDISTGESVPMKTLRKRDIQLFMKRLRKMFSQDKIRFYAAGEYGSSTQRPHYHLIVFGLHLGKLIPCGMSETGNPYYRSPELEKAWSDPNHYGLNVLAGASGMSSDLLGFVSCEPANYFTFKYVASYVTKKLGIAPNEAYIASGIEPPFSLSSRRPGIGKQFFIDHPEALYKDEIVVGTIQGAVRFPLPKFAVDMLRDLDPDFADQRAEARMKSCDDRVNAELSQTSLYYLDYLKVKEASLTSRQNKRNLI